jgi:type IX secretion system PorP/SprF family membrane protein
MWRFVFLVLLFPFHVLQAQPLARYNLYPFSRNFANPAATGLTDCLEFTATDMHQWLGISDAPNIQSFSIQKGKPFSKRGKYGTGINLVRDANGPTRSLGGEFIYSFHRLIGRNRTTWLSLGLSGSIEQRRLDESEFTPVFDPQVTGGVVQEWAYNAASGLYLYNNRYFAGFAVYNLLPVNTYLSMGNGGDRYYVSFQGGYLYTIRSIPGEWETSFQGSLGIQVFQFDLTNRMRFENNVSIGLTLRKYAGKYESAGQDAIVSIGYGWKDWNFSYNYIIDINGTQFHHFGTHQVSIGYKICPDQYSCPAY